MEADPEMNPLSRKQLLLATSELNRKSLMDDVQKLTSSTAMIRQRVRTVSICLFVGAVVALALVLRRRKTSK